MPRVSNVQNNEILKGGPGVPYNTGRRRRQVTVLVPRETFKLLVEGCAARRVSRSKFVADLLEAALRIDERDDQL